jgi:DMSO/TMAO reductase YedYZ heme-binding membrane subunit
MTAVELELTLVRTTGWCAAALLVLTIAPLGRFKRSLGLGALACALVHLAIAAFTPLVPALELLWYEPHLRSGATALSVLAFLGATSFPALVRGLGLHHWKELHRAVYVALLLVLHHAILSPHLPRIGAVALSAAVVFGLALNTWRGTRAA